ncbi:hypothetical protein [Owenweeksia hongkongensis]|uniref:hypothetical protein n=1 Tax=Owenweeksia hongkongensis TaxID=253245 RepID=UPI003A8CB5E0
MLHIKKVSLLTLIASFVILFSCKKEDKESVIQLVSEFPYEKRLEGSWKLKAVEYDSEIPDFTGSGSPTRVSGSGVSVNGKINFQRNPNLMDYNFAFIAMVDLTGTGFPLPIPIDFEGSGEWTTTSDQSKVILTDGETEFIFDVLVNEEDIQVLETTISQDFQGILSLEVDVVLTFDKVN